MNLPRSWWQLRARWRVRVIAARTGSGSVSGRVVTERGGKLILAADIQQLQPVEKGRRLGLLAGRLGYL